MSNGTTFEQFYSFGCFHGEHKLCTNHPEKANYSTRVFGCECLCHYSIRSRKAETRGEVLITLSHAMWYNQIRVDDKEFARIIKKFLGTIQPAVYDDEVDALIPVFRAIIDKDYWSRDESHQELSAAKVIEQPKLI